MVCSHCASADIVFVTTIKALMLEVWRCRTCSAQFTTSHVRDAAPTPIPGGPRGSGQLRVVLCATSARTSSGSTGLVKCQSMPASFD